MTEYLMNLAVKPGCDVVQTGYQAIFEAESREEAETLYLEWLMEDGWEQEEVQDRILCDEWV